MKDYNNEDRIMVGDIVKLDISYGNNINEIKTLKLVDHNPSTTSNIPEASVFSIIGKSINGKKVGQTVDTVMNKTSVTINIVEKIPDENQKIMRKKY